MIEILIVAIVIGWIGLKLTSKDRFQSEGETRGICKEVRIEYTDNNGSPYNEQMVGTDGRMYRPYIEYTWKGNHYIAKSYRAYSQAKFFPGDEVSIQVSRSDKGVVNIRR